MHLQSTLGSERLATGLLRLEEPYTQLRYDSHSGNDLCGPAGAGLRQLSERLPEPLARGRERRQAALPLPPVRPHAGLVGECAAGQLARSARPLPHLPRLDRLALSAGGAGGRGALGDCQLAISAAVFVSDIVAAAAIVSSSTMVLFRSMEDVLSLASGWLSRSSMRSIFGFLTGSLCPESRWDSRFSILHSCLYIRIRSERDGRIAAQFLASCSVSRLVGHPRRRRPHPAHPLGLLARFAAAKASAWATPS